MLYNCYGCGVLRILCYGIDRGVIVLLGYVSGGVLNLGGLVVESVERQTRFRSSRGGLVYRWEWDGFGLRFHREGSGGGYGMYNEVIRAVADREGIGGEAGELLVRRILSSYYEGMFQVLGMGIRFKVPGVGEYCLWVGGSGSGARHLGVSFRAGGGVLRGLREFYRRLTSGGRMRSRLDQILWRERHGRYGGKVSDARMRANYIGSSDWVE